MACQYFSLICFVLFENISILKMAAMSSVNPLKSLFGGRFLQCTKKTVERRILYENAKKRLLLWGSGFGLVASGRLCVVSEFERVEFRLHSQNERTASREFGRFASKRRRVRRVFQIRKRAQ